MNQLQTNDVIGLYSKVVELLGITYRQTQIDFITTLYDSFFTAPVVGFNESPTGTGKSFSYLIPSFIHISQNPSEKVIISTKTLNLQEQLILKDIPTIQKAFSLISPDYDVVKVAVLKGRSNYLCGYRCFKEHKKVFSQHTDKLEKWLETSTGEKDDFIKLGFTYKDWKKVETKDSRECLKKGCPYYKHQYCCFNRAKEAAKEAQIVIVNHYLLFTDFWQRDPQRGLDNTIPISRYTNLIIDEAHLLEDIAIKIFTNTFHPDMVGEIIFGMRSTYALFNEPLAEKVMDSSGKLSNYIKKLDGDEIPETGKLQSLINICMADILSYIEYFNSIAESGLAFEAKIRLKSSINNLQDMLQTLGFVLNRNKAQFAVWKEGDNINVTLIDYKQVLQESLFNDKLCLNLVSATLSYMNQFYYTARSLFLDRITPSPKLVGKIYPPVFDKSKIQYVTPLNLADYRSEEYETQLLYITKKLVEANKGSALLLFTSLKRMDSVYAALVKEKYPFKIYKQSKEESKTDVINKFKQDVSSVLMGSYSFWEGIDIPGDSLTLIIIDKLPFETPTVVTKALSDQFVGFIYQCYKTALKLKQGVGRLIRSESDSGKIIICDNRLHGTYWGKQIYQTLQQ